MRQSGFEAGEDEARRWRAAARGTRALAAKWRRRTRAERLLLLEALVLLGVARLLVLAVPFRWFAGSLGRRTTEAPPPPEPAALERARSVGRAVRSAARYTPWQSVCLPQAVAAKWMLRRRRIGATLCLGVSKDASRPERLSAHAWLRCGDLVLTGARGHRRYAVVATFR